MVKILSQSGRSLADVYDVRGSIAGIDQLETHELPIVHEMGSTIFSERFRMTLRRVAPAAVLQSTAIASISSNMPQSITRVLGIVVVSDDASRIADASVSLRQPNVTQQEIPIWVWDTASTTPVRFLDNGSLVTLDLLVGHASAVLLPTFSGGSDQGSDAPTDMVLRGGTNAFGAGTAFLRAFYVLGFTFQGGVSSYGLPIPGW